MERDLKKIGVNIREWENTAKDQELQPSMGLPCGNHEIVQTLQGMVLQLETGHVFSCEQREHRGLNPPVCQNVRRRRLVNSCI